VCLTTPSYEGLSADIRGIASLCKSRNIRVLIDGAHGSIFPFEKDLCPESGINIDGVDIVVQSTHKGIGAFS
jgi:arginine/lysine/ornithine decarboxylase